MSKITVEEQRAMGLIRENYVPANPPTIIETTGHVIPDHQRVQLPQPITDLSVTPTATAHIDMRTSAQDRAWGFLIASTPRTFVFELSRRSTSSRMAAGTPQLSTVTSTAGPSSSVPIARALAKMCCAMPVFGSLRPP